MPMKGPRRQAAPPAKPDWGKGLRYRITCPNCWHGFHPEEVLYVARHPELLGDPVLGDNEYLRFQPTRFTTKGEALDGRGLPTSTLACPRCHLQIPEAMLEVPPLFVSVIGSPASGKSYFLTTMVWELRRLLPQAMLSFSDADPVANNAIHEYEQTLFMNPRPSEPTEIRKTQVGDPRLHRTALIDGVPIRHAVPFQFTLWPTASHAHYARRAEIGRIIVLYDNAGEDFLPGSEEHASAAAQHLARSEVLMVLFDPTQDPRFVQACGGSDPQFLHGPRPDAGAAAPVMRQETLLKEASVRIRRQLGASEAQRIHRPLIVVVPKFDVCEGLAGVSLVTEPYRQGVNDKLPLVILPEEVERTSDTLRDLMVRFCPEFVATAEGLSETVVYIPVSSLGRSPEYITRGEHRFYGIRPKDIHPRWVTVPLVYCLHKWVPGIIGAERSGGR